MLRESLPLGDSCAECKRWRLVGAGCRSRRSRDGIAVLAFDVSAAIAVRGARVTSAALAANVHVTGYLVCKEMRLLAIAWATRRPELQSRSVPSQPPLPSQQDNISSTTVTGY
ncbi:hypothetical protein AC579_8366 [Pseudocercospora musae]|uniref:Uncharacterized protein n=1 Tax=Pseudocercospora musae TaxID=113226 RepID=A0A139IHW9_9PEZI|nr:hypothetical protein AC579_8366 [Pseudocercospora musae]